MTTVDVMDKRLKQFESKIGMKQILKQLDSNICEKMELNSISKQLDSQRILLKQLKEQSDVIANKISHGEHYQLTSSPTMARQIANKMRLEKQLNDLKQELNEKKHELQIITQKLTNQANELQQQQNELILSIESNTNSLSNSQIVCRRVEEIQRLYKMREKHLKKELKDINKNYKKG